jgi:transposase-like protein
MIATRMSRKSRAKPASPFRCFNSSPEVIGLVVMMYVRFPLSLRNVEDLLYERGIDICHETVRMWWNRFGPMFAGDIRRQRISGMRGFCQHNGSYRIAEVSPGDNAGAVVSFESSRFGRARR